jgi:hypothetical protein
MNDVRSIQSDEAEETDSVIPYNPGEIPDPLIYRESNQTQ